MALRIANLTASSEHLKFSPDEKTISQTFVLDRHIRAIGLMAKQLNFTVSVRESGAPTLRCLSLGAAAKGHDILEKTIKPDSIKNAYHQKSDAVMTKITAAKIDGYVGHWDQIGGLQGLYVGPEARDIPSLAAKLLKTQPDAKDYYPVDIDHLEDSLKTLKEAPNWQAIPFTGDYDLHDMINFSGPNGPVPQGSEQETKILTAINTAVSAIDTESRALNLTHKNVVRHGPQHNYFAYMQFNEPKNKVLGAVAKPSFPLAMCHRGEWSIIHNVKELENFYTKAGLKLKSSWSNSEGYFNELGSGEVSHRRTSKKPLK